MDNLYISDWWLSPTPLKHMSSSVGMMKFPIYRKINVFQTTNQLQSPEKKNSFSTAKTICRQEKLLKTIEKPGFCGSMCKLPKLPQHGSFQRTCQPISKDGGPQMVPTYLMFAEKAME